MEHIGIKLSIPSGVTTVGISARDMVSSSRMGSTSWPRVDHGEGCKWSHCGHNGRGVRLSQVDQGGEKKWSPHLD